MHAKEHGFLGAYTWNNDAQYTRQPLVEHCIYLRNGAPFERAPNFDGMCKLTATLAGLTAPSPSFPFPFRFDGAEDVDGGRAARLL